MRGHLLRFFQLTAILEVSRYGRGSESVAADLGINLAALGRKRSGTSYTASVQAEELLKPNWRTMPEADQFIEASG